MLDIKQIIKDVEEMKKNVIARNMNADIDNVISLYNILKKKKQDLEHLNSEINKSSQQFKHADDENKKIIRDETKKLKVKIANLKTEILEYQKQYQNEMLRIPNFCAQDVPDGRDDVDNVEITKYLEATKFNFKPRNHVELCVDLDIVDFEAGAKVTGPKFYFLKGKGVLLEIALIRYAIDVVLRNGFQIVSTPDLAKDDIIVGSGFTPRGKESQIYSIDGMDISLIGTSEITIGGYMANKTIIEDDLPIKFAGLSHCFRTEAGSYGRESKGLYRVHQFSKVEMYQFVTPNKSNEVLEEMRKIEEEIYQSLRIPYRVVNICKGDLGAPAYKKYDIEAWMPGHGEKGGYGEITSVSNCTDFQSRRLNIRFKDKGVGENFFVHTLNGTAIATTRVMLAILENGQREDGSVEIPEVLHQYTGFKEIKSV